MIEVVTNTSPSLRASPRPVKTDLGAVAWFSLFVLVGVLGTILHPFSLLGCLAVAATSKLLLAGGRISAA